MIALVYSRSGYVKAYATYCFLDQAGNFSEKGPFLYVEKMWVHPGHRRKSSMKRMIAEMYSKAVGVHTVYWQSERKNQIVKFHISRFEKYVEENHEQRKLEKAACAAVAC